MDERQLRALFARLDSMLQGVRQYIGARYVPRFVGVYDPTQSYEALDVVDNGSGTSYIAKIPTPAGTPLTDTDHWFLYGSTNGAIINLQQQIDDMKDINESGSLQNQIGDLTDLDTTDKDNLVDAINEHDSEIQALTNDVSLLKNRKIVFVSDSYGARTYNSKTLIELIAERIGLTTYEDIQANGSGFIGLGSPRPTFLEMVQGHTFTIPANEITDIVVLGGANDLTSTENDILTAISSFCNYCKTTFVNAKIRIAHVGRYWNKTYLNQIKANSLKAWRQCNLYGACYIKNSEYILHKRSLCESDDVHPSSAGVNELARQIANALLIGYCDVHYSSTCNWAVQNGALYDSCTLSDAVPIHISVDNEITTVTFGAGTTINAYRTNPATQAQKIPINDVLTLPQGSDQLAMFGNYPDNVTKGIPVTVGIRNDTLLTQGNVPGSIYFASTDQCYINVYLYMLNKDWSTLTVGGVQIMIQGDTMTLASDEC